ncbi:MAG TPA: DinB family protein [Pyrinomonadaceae bacterium]|jgi:hypothetical protein
MNKQEIAARLIESHRNFTDCIDALSESEFMFAPAGKWTAGQQLKHVARSVAPLAKALALPKFVPHLLFGKAKRLSTDYDSLVENYQGKLAAGGKASGKYIPPEIGFAERVDLKNKLTSDVADLTERIGKFSETQLDEYVLPHPLLGDLTIREMLYFTIYHVGHHHRATLKNLGK